MKVCKAHVKKPATIYGQCVGCEIDGLRNRIQELEAQLAAAPTVAAVTTSADQTPHLIAFIERFDKRLEAAGYSHLQRVEIAHILMSNKVESEPVAQHGAKR